MARRVRLVAVALLVAALVEAILAVELVGQGASVDPRFRVFLAGWLETEVWVDLRLLAAAVVAFAGAVTLLLATRRTPTDPG